MPEWAHAKYVRLKGFVEVGVLPYPRWEVTTSVSAGPGQVADNVEHLELELWRRGEEKNKNMNMA